MNFPILRQTLTLAHASLRVRYRQTWSGFLWVILNPIILLGAQGIIFSSIFNINILKYFFYFASGLLPWFFLSQTLDMGTSLLRSQSSSIKSYFVPPVTFILALCLENFLNFAASTLLIVLPLMIFEGQPLWILLFWILSLIPLVITTSAFTFITSTANIVYRDVRFVVSFVLSVFYFLTPIFYKLEILPTKIQAILIWNPFFIMIAPFQTWALGHSVQTWLVAFSKSVLLMGFVLAIAKVHWNKIKNPFYLNI